MSVDQRFSSSCAAHHRGVLSSKEVESRGGEQHHCPVSRQRKYEPQLRRHFISSQCKLRSKLSIQLLGLALSISPS